MKKYFIMAVAVLATLTACQPDEPQTTIVETREICFAPAATQTRAAATATEEGNLATLTLNGFAVFGFQGEDQIFDNTLVTHSTKNETLAGLGLEETTNAWAPAAAANVRYWAIENYKFSGVYPATNNGYSMDEDGKQTITNFVNDGTKDLLVSNVNSVNNTTLQKSQVALRFDHMLSRVKFTFTNKFTGNELMEISGVKINGVANDGSAEIETGDGTADTKTAPTWTAGSEDITLVFGEMSSQTTENRFAKETQDVTVYKYIIPENDTEYTIDFNVVVYSEGVQVAAKEYTGVRIKKEAYDFEPGKSYTFNANIAADDAGEIYPIEFTVEVSAWEEVDGGDIDLSGN